MKRRDEIMEKLNVYLADMVAGHAKLQNLHWNVVGKAFIQVHEYLEEIYRGIYEHIDQVAEYMVMNGQRPIGTVKEFAENTTIKEIESQEYKTGESVRLALTVVKSLRDTAHEIHEETDDYMLEALLEEHIEDHNKQIWFIESMIQPDHRPESERPTIE